MAERRVDASSPPPLHLQSLQYDVTRSLSNAKMERRSLRSPRCSGASPLASPRSAVVTPRGRVRMDGASSPVSPASATGTALGGDPAWGAGSAFSPAGALGNTPKGTAASPATSPPKSPTAELGITPPARSASTRQDAVGSTLPSEEEATPRSAAADDGGSTLCTFSPPARRGSTRPVRSAVPVQIFRHKELEASIR